MTPVNRRDFTLIELLVVVSIITVLAAILLPLLGRARKQAKITICMNNTRTLALATTMYALDEDNWLVRRGGDPINYSFPNIVGTHYLDSMSKYLTDTRVYSCPDGAIDAASKVAFAKIYGGSLEYTYYSDLRAFGTVTPYSAFTVNSQAAKVPNRLSDDQDGFGGMSMIYGDVNRWRVFPSDPIHVNHASRWKTDFVGAIVYHNGYPAGVNNAYIDGHCEWIRTRELRTTRYFRSLQNTDSSYHWR